MENTNFDTLSTISDWEKEEIIDLITVHPPDIISIDIIDLTKSELDFVNSPLPFATNKPENTGATRKIRKTRPRKPILVNVSENTFPDAIEREMVGSNLKRSTKRRATKSRFYSNCPCCNETKVSHKTGRKKRASKRRCQKSVKSEVCEKSSPSDDTESTEIEIIEDPEDYMHNLTYTNPPETQLNSPFLTSTANPGRPDIEEAIYEAIGRLMDPEEDEPLNNNIPDNNGPYEENLASLLESLDKFLEDDGDELKEDLLEIISLRNKHNNNNNQ